ncbi:MAG: DUF255 domain-containing protein [Halobacteriota archaeon]
MDDDTRVEWRSWGQAAFDEAQRVDKPVLLSLSATWCAGCHEMDAETYGEPRIAANVNDRFVPVRVDVDREPRVRERYNMGGFPSTVFTTPTGDVLTGAMYLGPDGMRQVLNRVEDLWAEKGAEAGRIPRALAGDPTPEGPVTPVIEQHLAGQLTEKYDDQYAGWGDDAKFPLPRTVEFALKREQAQALRTLDAVHRNLFDDVEGGFFRYAERRDWSSPHHEKTLDANAALLRAFANAYLYTGETAYLDAATETREFLVETLWNGAAFGSSVGPGDAFDYYGLDADEREETTGPRRDLTPIAGSNALAADALLTLVAYTDDERAREYAERTLAYVEAELVDDGVVTRCRTDDDAGESGLLEDHARVAAAFVRASQVLSRAYLGTAESVIEHALETLFEDGSFLDGPRTGPGLLDRPFRPLDGNVEMADALLDVAVLTDEDRYRTVASESVGAFAGAAERIGIQVAGYGTVAARLCGEPLVVAVGTAAGSELHRAALRVADHEKVVVPEAEGVSDGTAVVSVGDETASAHTPDELLGQVRAVLERTD